MSLYRLRAGKSADKLSSHFSRFSKVPVNLTYKSEALRTFRKRFFCIRFITRLHGSSCHCVNGLGAVSSASKCISYPIKLISDTYRRRSAWDVHSKKTADTKVKLSALQAVAMWRFEQKNQRWWPKNRVALSAALLTAGFQKLSPVTKNLVIFDLVHAGKSNSKNFKYRETWHRNILTARLLICDSASAATHFSILHMQSRAWSVSITQPPSPFVRHFLSAGIRACSSTDSGTPKVDFQLPIFISDQCR